MVSGVIKEIWRLLNRQEKLRMILTVAVNSSLSLLDIVAVAIVGAVGALAVNNIKGTNSGDRVTKLLSITSLDSFSTSSQIIILASIAVLFLALKSVFSFQLTKKIFQFSNRCSNRLSISLLKEWTNKDITFLESRSTQENVFILSSGISNLNSGVLGNFFALTTDVLLSLLLFSSLLLVDKLSAAICLGTLGVTLIILFRKSSNLSFHLGKQQVMKSVIGNEMTAEFLNSWREIYARQSDIYYLNSIKNNREILTKNATNMKMIPMSSRYIIETLVIVILLGVTALQFAINDASRASGNIALFMAASTRFAPALLRIQQYAIQLINSAGQAKRTLDVINEKQFKKQKEESFEEAILQTTFPESPVILKCEEISFKYPGSHKNTLEDINLEIVNNSLTAIIGPSGSGKSTLIDLMLGLLTPTAGKVRLAGDSPKKMISSKRIKIAYVPQAVQIHKGTLRDNILLGIPSSEIDDETIMQALRKSGVMDLKELGGNDLNMMIGDRGMTISGGQRQRIGVARALVTKPQIIFLDEITSALDPKSENQVSNALLEMRIDTTIVVIAHKLSTIESADQIVYLDEGKILARGNYSELRNLLPEFEYQVRSIGLE